MTRIQTDLEKSQKELEAHNDLERQRIMANLIGRK
jgi:hypothetical protein